MKTPKNEETPHIDPLQALVATDTSMVNREKLAQILKDYVVLESSGAVSFKQSFRDLDNLRKIEIILASVKARSLLFGDFADGIQPSEIINFDAMPEGSVKFSLKKLYDARKIKKDSDKRYYLPNYRIDDLLGQ